MQLDLFDPRPHELVMALAGEHKGKLVQVRSVRLEGGQLALLVSLPGLEAESRIWVWQAHRLSAVCLCAHCVSAQALGRALALDDLLAVVGVGARLLDRETGVVFDMARVGEALEIAPPLAPVPLGRFA